MKPANISQTQLHQAVAKVLMGGTSRAELIEQRPVIQVYAAVALVWAKRSMYLDKDHNTKVSYRKLLDELLVTGVKGVTPISRISYLAQKSKKAGLHGPSTHKSLRCGVQLTPPGWLINLANAYHDHSAVQKFFDTAAEAAESERHRVAQVCGPLDEAWRDDALRTMVIRVRENFGLEGVRKLTEIAQECLQPPTS